MPGCDIFLVENKKNLVIRDFDINGLQSGITCTTNPLKEEREHNH